MNNEQYEDVCYKKNFLHQVIIRLDFLEFIPNVKLFDDKILQTILEHFPKRHKAQLVRFSSINVNIEGFDEERSATTSSETLDGLKQTFSDNNQNKIIIANRFILFEINHYETFEKVIKWVSTIFTSFFTLNSITVMRTGIRYINLFDTTKVKVVKKYFTGRIAASLETKIPVDYNGIKCLRSMHRMEFIVDDMVLNFQYGMYNPDYPRIMQRNDFSLDYDCFFAEPLNDCVDIIKYIRKGHSSIQTLFENSITDSLRSVLNGE